MLYLGVRAADKPEQGAAPHSYLRAVTVKSVIIPKGLRQKLLGTYLWQRQTKPVINLSIQFGLVREQDVRIKIT